MLTDKFFIFAQMGHEVTLWILVVLSVLSISFILERWLTLSKYGRNSSKIESRIVEILQSSQLDEVESLGKDLDSLESQALKYGLRHVKQHGTEGLEELFNSYAAIERKQLDKYLNFFAAELFTYVHQTVLAYQKFKCFPGGKKEGSKIGLESPIDV